MGLPVGLISGRATFSAGGAAASTGAGAAAAAGATGAVV
jgi:hypothetical protein